ncbi:4-hydroxy-tetrahydrodipicolinate reductase [Buchnera aphidicola (Thelaxes suberi)]|uniref:4-hydroxy-tetrahydrodipicolinate reductase n=1 Tax=Buchnera aphidicola TaxID=9 RepID=UPI0034641A4D
MIKNINIAIVGALGKIGTLLTQTIQQTNDCTLIASIITKKQQFNDEKNNFNVFSCLSQAIKNNDIDVIIDFSTPKSTMEQIIICQKFKKNMVIGTTGFSSQQKKIIMEASKNIGIVHSANFSIGINLMHTLLKKTAKMIGNNTDIEIIEYHHRNKKDTPSGTALYLGNTICNTLNWNLEKSAIYRKKEITNGRKNNTIGFSSIRAGNIIGEHKVIFVNESESIEITHKAMNRLPFVKGAIQAAKWILNKKNGLFDMHDVLK